jgi:hypothetical protein
MGVYITQAATAWFIGFFPFFGLYVAIPAAVALELDHVSAVVWASLGNFTPVLLIVLAFERLRKLPRIGPWLETRSSERFQRLADSYGMGLVLLITPIIGVWALAVTGVSLGMSRYKLVIFSGISILLYALLISMGVTLGIEAFQAAGE